MKHALTAIQQHALTITLISAVILAILVGLFQKNRHTYTTTYKARGVLCTKAEIAFLRVLEQAISPAHQVFAMVRLADVIQPTTKSFTARNQITGKHLDFVVCDRATTCPVYAVELNDSSHTRADRQARDTFLAGAMAAAGIPLIFYKVERTYSVEKLRTALFKATQITVPPRL